VVRSGFFFIERDKSRPYHGIFIFTHDNVVVYNKEDLSTTMNLHKGLPILYLFLLGATLGTALDAFHVYSGVERYPAPVFLGVAWWVPLLFGGAAVAIGCSHVKIDPLLGQRRRPVRWRGVWER